MTENSIGKYLWMSVVMFVTYLFLGSFIVCRNIFDLAYLIILYIFIIVANIKKINFRLVTK